MWVRSSLYKKRWNEGDEGEGGSFYDERGHIVVVVALCWWCTMMHIFCFYLPRVIFLVFCFSYISFFFLSFTSAFKSFLVERLPPTSNFPYSIVFFFLKYVSQQNILTSCAFINSIKTWKCLFTNLKQLFSWFLYLQKCIFVVA